MDKLSFDEKNVDNFMTAEDTLSASEIVRLAGATSIPYQPFIYENLASTNEWAKETSFSPASVPLVIARAQSAGKGRNGRRFSSPPGGVYVSFVYEESQLPHRWPFLFFAPCLAVCMALQRWPRVRPYIKWPNDILCDGRKVGGILSETVIRGNNWRAVLGIGVNFSTPPEAFPADIRERAGTLAAYTAGAGRNECIAELIKAMDALRQYRSPEQYWREYKKRLTLLGQDITVITAHEKIPAKALDVCPDGALLIETDGGARRKIFAGDVSVRG